MSILDLYYSVDTFWTLFAPRWERELLASGQRRRRRATRLHPAEILTILILFQQSGEPHLQRVLHPARPGCPAPGVSSYLELQPLCRTYATLPRAARHLPAHAAGSMHGRQLHRLHLAGRLPPGADSAAPCVCRRRPPWKDLGGRPSMALSSIWSSTTVASCSRFASLPATPMIGGLCPSWRGVSSDGSLATRAISHSHSQSSSSLPKDCASSPNCARICASSSSNSPTGSCCASAP